VSFSKREMARRGVRPVRKEEGKGGGQFYKPSSVEGQVALEGEYRVRGCGFERSVHKSVPGWWGG